ncbi:MAG: DUF1059 domain-containing protein [Candidatus Hermodarchaeia archaeon]
MVITYTCRDLGVDCDWSASSETEEGLMEKSRTNLIPLFFLETTQMLICSPLSKSLNS